MAFNKKTHLRQNIDALKTAFTLDRERRAPTPEEERTLGAYSGFGAIKEVLENPDLISRTVLAKGLDAGTSFDYAPGDCVFVPGIRQAIENGIEDIPARVIRTDGAVEDLMLHVKGLTDDEKEIILDGCLMNYYAKRN